MEACSKQQPDFSEDSPGTVRKSLPNQTMQLVSACWEEPLGPGQIEKNGTRDPTVLLLANQTGPRSQRKFK